MMTKGLLKVSPQETANECLDVMKQRRCRHLPVFDGDECLGIVSRRDIVVLIDDGAEDEY